MSLIILAVHALTVIVVLAKIIKDDSEEEMYFG